MASMAAKTKSHSSDGSAKVMDLDDDNFQYELRRRDEANVLNDKYLLGKVIGRGASAEVIEILDMQSLQRKVVKVFGINRRFSLSQSPETKEKEIIVEYRILRRLNHPNVLKVFDLIRIQDQFQIKMFVVTEYCAGSLEEVRLASPERRLPLKNCHFYFHQLMDGIEYLHSKSIIHGDVKPDNLMLLNDNTLKIVDFGSCFDMGIFPGNEKKGISGGSAYFQPPESLAEANVDENPDWATRVKLMISADVWSCGIVLFMIACGRHPFQESDIGSEGELHDAIMKKLFAQTEIIHQNRALDLLFRKIFQTDWRKRATITDIKRDPWYKISVSHSDTAGIPVRKNQEGRPGDKYRSMSMTEALNQYFRPIADKVKILGKDLPDFEGRKEIPYVRANRSPEAPRSPPVSLVRSLRNRAARLRRRF